MHGDGNEGELRFGSLLLQPARRLLLRDGRALAVGARAFDVLTVLAQERHRIVGKAELLDRVWPERVVEEANLAVQISTLRRLIGNDAIATIPGRGYRFVAAVEDAPAAPPTPQPPQADDAGLIGRDDDRAALAAALADSALVSVVGPGGIGKTRLAQALAVAEAARRRDGVRWVDLAPLARDDEVAVAVMQAVQGSSAPVADAARVAQALVARELLLVLDNAEHVAAGAAALVRAVLAAAPGVRVLATSQAPLAVAGERVYRLQPLAVPPPGDAMAGENYAAVRLFAERARADDLRFAIADAAAAADVGAICRALDGLPLAIELAAARVRLLGVRGLRQRLDERLQLLAAVRGPAQEAAPRHQTLRAALDWSHALLAEREQRLLRRLAPFVGGFTLELAQQAAAEPGFDAWQVLDALDVLVDRSLVAIDGADPPRYRLLETLREFAFERLAEAGEMESARSRHARGVGALFEQVEQAVHADGAPPDAAARAIARLRPELDNARAALAFARAASDWPLALTLAAGAAPVAAAAGALHEWLPTLRALQPHADAAPLPVQALFLWRLGSYGVQAGIGHAELLRIKEQAVDRARCAGHRRLLQRTLAALGFGRTRVGDEAGTVAVLAEMAALERAGDPPIVPLLRLNVETTLAEMRGDVNAALAAIERQRELLRGAGEPQAALANDANHVMFLNAAGRHAEAAAAGRDLLQRTPEPPPYVLAFTVHALAAAGEVDAALALARQRRRLWSAAPIGVYAAEALAMLALARGRLATAVRIDAALERHRLAVGGRLHPLTAAFRRRLAAALQEAGTAAAESAAWRAEGERLADADAIEAALGDRAGAHR